MIFFKMIESICRKSHFHILYGWLFLCYNISIHNINYVNDYKKGGNQYDYSKNNSYDKLILEVLNK